MLVYKKANSHGIKASIPEKAKERRISSPDFTSTWGSTTANIDDVRPAQRVHVLAWYMGVCLKGVLKGVLISFLWGLSLYCKFAVPKIVKSLTEYMKERAF